MSKMSTSACSGITVTGFDAKGWGSHWGKIEIERGCHASHGETFGEVKSFAGQPTRSEKGSSLDPHSARDRAASGLGGEGHHQAYSFR
jgi:hypothetical protein